MTGKDAYSAIGFQGISYLTWQRWSLILVTKCTGSCLA